MLVYTDLEEVTVESFLNNFKAHTKHFVKEGGKPLGLISEGKQYVLLPFSATDNLSIQNTNAAYTETARNGNRSFYQDLKLTKRQLVKELSDLDDHHCFVITTPKQENLCVITKDAFETMEYRKARQAAKVRRQNGIHASEEPTQSHTASLQKISPESGPEDLSIPQDEPDTITTPEEILAMTTPKLITAALSHWDNTKANHREEELDESVTLHREKPVGVLLSAERASQMGLPCDILSDKEVSWATRFKDNHTGFKALLPQAGLVKYKSQTHYYTSLGHVLANEGLYADHIDPALMAKMKEEAERLNNALILEYFRKLNPIDLSSLKNRIGAYVVRINDALPENLLVDVDTKTGVPLAGLHSTKLKLIMLPGDQSTGMPEDIKVFREGPMGFKRVWGKEMKSTPSANQVIVISYKGRSGTILPPTLEHPAIKATISQFTPPLEEMVNVANEELKDFVKGRQNAPSNAQKPQQKDASVAEEPAVPAPVVAEPIAPAVEELQISEPPIANFDPPGLTAASEQMQGIIKNLQVISDAIKTLKTTQEKIVEAEIDGNFVAVFDTDVFDQLPIANAKILSGIYNSLRQQDEPEANLETVAIGGTAATKIKALRRVFENSSDGNITIMKSEENTLIVTRNKNFMECVSAMT